MAILTPFHARTSALCTSYLYKDWNDYAAVCRYDAYSEREYFAIRHAVGLLDVTPLYKYEVTGPDAARLLSRVCSRNIEKYRVGRVVYCCLVDPWGKALDDCTVGRLTREHYRLTTSVSWFDWLCRHARGLEVQIVDSTKQLAALALQGPNARAVLKPLIEFDMDKMRFFRVRKTRLDGIDLWVSRTGYTGDLGFELWMSPDDALDVWDRLIESGQPHGIEPFGLDALDVVRIEAGYVLQAVDYFSARDCIIESRKSSPYEIGLEWTVDLERDVPVLGQTHLEREARDGSAWALVGLEIDWEALEALYDEYGLPPHLSPVACRDAVPVYDARGRTQVGQATSTTWSPVLKKYIALATVRAPFGIDGTELRIEHTVEFNRRQLPATVVDRPFFDPPRKRFTPAAQRARP